MSPEEAARLLAAVRAATENGRRLREEANARALAMRREAVQAAMAAGLPREDIAEAAGVNRRKLYRITGTG